jgi:gliding motility-associated-like protein
LNFLEKLFLVTLLFWYTFSFAQNSISAGVNESLFIKSGTTFFIADLELKPTSDITLSNIGINKQATSTAANSISNITKVFVLSNALSNYNGTIKIQYSLAELNSLSPSDLQVSIYNAIQWNNQNGSTLNTLSKTVEASLSGVLIKEITLSGESTSTPNSPLSSDVGSSNTNQDRDGDGYPNNVDAFPDDPSEWIDLDNDGIGNNSDLDIDGDGFSNLIEETCFSDQLDPFDVPADFDNDGIPNCIDEDDDNDLYSDEDEVTCGSNPFDQQDKPLDTDSDLLANCIDPDDDNDNYLDQNDAFPLDNTEWIDTDLDGLGNNIDLDDDNDYYNDLIEIEANTDPLDPNSYPKDFSVLKAKGLIKIVNFFSPNGDGVNDTWQAFEFERYFNNQVWVYTRDGRLVFNQKNYTNNWRGDYKAQELPEGSYYYRIDLDLNGVVDFEGWMYLSR